jgi:SanA protein
LKQVFFSSLLNYTNTQHGRIPPVFKKTMKIILITILALCLVAILVPLAARVFTAALARSKTYTLADVPVRRVAIVFGAGLWRDGTATPVLKDRVHTAVDLYFSGKVEKLLMSGDNRFIEYNEPAVMREVALSLGVPQEAIVLDYAGRRSYDTCYRAREIFGVSQAILVTQAFHLPRVLYLCNRLGVDSIGVQADMRVYRKLSRLVWNTRETLATLAALWDINVSHPVPVLGEKETIFP